MIIDSSQGVINRIEYDHLGKIRNQAASPQVELLWRAAFYNSDTDIYFLPLDIYDPIIGSYMIVIHRESDIKKITIIPYYIGLILFGSFMITYGLDNCRRALQTLEDLHTEWDTMHGLGDSVLREAQAAAWGFGSYSSWSRSWIERGQRNSENINGFCRGVNI